MIEFERLRRIACLAGPSIGISGVTSQQWYDQATSRMDAMRVVERKIDEDLQATCKAKLAASETASDADAGGDAAPRNNVGRYPIALVLGDADQELLADAAKNGLKFSLSMASARVSVVPFSTSCKARQGVCSR